jgi:hypothetical protein
MMVALMLPPTMSGMADASATRRPSCNRVHALGPSLRIRRLISVWGPAAQERAAARDQATRCALVQLRRKRLPVFGQADNVK